MNPNNSEGDELADALTAALNTPRGTSAPAFPLAESPSTPAALNSARLTEELHIALNYDVTPNFS
ncbi:hypothetical protein [Gulosibacter sediminis]|uniref:hypothetical protein n=1 Tax=Gulosibacter sediminis TaxID=1729695 RepID=UPI0024A98311|nr:hypothetical protein [Gulosibacter sediminis]